MKEYNTVKDQAVSEIVEKKSRFICSVKPVDNEEQAMEFIKEVSERHRDATHNVYAYIIAGRVEIQRASDDGEPQGTAGIPVLEVIKKEGLTNICVVVTRYFGGILLGTGGLIRAYSSAAREGILHAGICRKALYSIFKINIDYSFLGKLQNAVTSLGNNIIRMEYTDSIGMFVKARHDRVERLTRTVTDLTCGKAVMELQKTCYDTDMEE
jgi:uncharacterized YigZ family protein